MKYDKDEIKNLLTINDIFDILQEFGGDPTYTSFGILSITICHNPPGEGSKKLYYYSNSNLFQCYSNCDNFDIFDLVIKVASIQWHKQYNLYDAIRWIAQRFGLSGSFESEDQEELLDWQIFNTYNNLKDIQYQNNTFKLTEYNGKILDNFNYTVKIQPWLNEGISQETLERARIGYYPGGDQITIPHFDIDNHFIGLRGRTLCAADAEIYGKYHPLKINKILYNHPLSMNLYNLNNSKENIKILQKAIVFESEKSTLQFASFMGFDKDISVASCGSSISSTQINLLLNCGAKEIIIGFDRQFEDLNTEESKKWIKKLTSIYNKYKNDALISIIFDKNKITGYKSSPTDEGKEKFLTLFKERIVF